MTAYVDADSKLDDGDCDIAGISTMLIIMILMMNLIRQLMLIR